MNMNVALTLNGTVSKITTSANQVNNTQLTALYDVHVTNLKNYGVQVIFVLAGSPVATSLSEGETVAKHVGLLKIHKKSFKMTKIPLETVRPFVMEDLMLSETSINPDDHDVGMWFQSICSFTTCFCVYRKYVC